MSVEEIPAVTEGRPPIPDPPREPETTSRLADLLAALEGAEAVLVLTHNNPDPDALASAAALAVLLQREAGVTTRVAFGGIIGRAENRALMQEMEIEFERMEDVDVPRGVAIAMVDTQPRAGNNALPPGRIVSAVIDHHPPRADTTAATFTDIRPEYGASGSILVEYLRAAGITPDRWLATALFYAIQSETMDLGREASVADVRASMYLYPRSDPAAISRIRHARVPPSYFRTMHEALAVTRRHDRVISVPLGKLPYPDMVAEIADLFLQMNGIDWTLASGRYRDRLLVSVRTYDEGAHAGSLVREAIGDRGSAGGHGSFAGGQVDLRGLSEEEVEEVTRGILRDLLEALGADPDESVPLVDPDSPPASEGEGADGERG